MSTIQNVAIIGGGPAGGTLGTLLAQAGLTVTIFNQGKRPELIVGESLIPGMIPLLRRLGLEDAVAAMGRFKPGATMFLPGGVTWSLPFAALCDEPADYAYNVPRTLFDRLFLKRAQEVGCTVVEARPEVQASGDSIKLPNGDFDLIIDASGRARLFSRLLTIGEQRGSRKDTALFAHVTDADLPYDGNIHMNILPYGWTWRIPLADRVSVGIVAPESALRDFGESAEEMYDRAVAALLSDCVRGETRCTPVVKYSNYQLVSDRMQGSNWVMVGDAAGFIDPVFSSGTYLAIWGATTLADTILTQGFSGLPAYEQTVKAEIAAWRQLIDSFYDGRFFSMIHAGERLRSDNMEAFSRLDSERVIARIISGYGTNSVEDTRLFSLFLSASATKNTPAEYAIA